MATTTPAAVAKLRGGAFLLETYRPDGIFTPEDFTDEHRAVARATEEFYEREVTPRLKAIQQQEPGVAVSVLRKSAELGLVAVLTPEKYGGMEMDLVSALIVAEKLTRDGSYAAWHAAHAGIGTLPLLLFGTEQQKARYLPRLSSAEMVAAYCLTESHAGSDALAARARADLAEDGTHYLLNGQKMWITNGGAADLYTVFAKVGGEKFSAFLVERAWPGVKPGAEEKKMGLQGSSTTAVYFDNVRVPIENLLGEAGRGHIIAFNILNLGRLKLGPAAVGGGKRALAVSLAYAAERVAFGHPIADFGMIQHKLAEMAIRIYAAESMSYRVAGMIESHLADFSWERPEAAERMLAAVEEFAAECSFIKVYASEMLDYVVDEGVQIHGGYGYHRDYEVERAYRDARINRIFEGTNEINRLLATGMLLKRAQKGALPLEAAVAGLQSELVSGPRLAASEGVEEGARLIANAKKIGLFSLGLAYRKYLARIEEQQEVMAAIADILMHAFAMESAWLRARKLASRGRGETAADMMTAVLLGESLAAIEQAARAVVANTSEGDAMRLNLAVLRRFAKCDPVDEIGLRRRIAARLLGAEKYVV